MHPSSSPKMSPHPSLVDPGLRFMSLAFGIHGIHYNIGPFTKWGLKTPYEWPYKWISHRGYNPTYRGYLLHPSFFNWILGPSGTKMDMEDSFQLIAFAAWVFPPQKQQQMAGTRKSSHWQRKRHGPSPKNSWHFVGSVVRFVFGGCMVITKHRHTISAGEKFPPCPSSHPVQCESRRSQSEKDSQIDRFGMPQTKFKLKRNNKNQLPSPPNWFMLYIYLFIYSFIYAP